MDKAALKENIYGVKSLIGDKALLVAVSKTVSADIINEAAELGVEVFGENYVAELCEKYDFLNKNKIKLHFIGHLQRNKVKYIVDKVCMIESVDSLRLAQEIEKQCAKCQKTMDVLIQVNIGREAQKGGVAPEELRELLFEVSKLPHIAVKGLMAIPPFDEDPHKYFVEMKALFDGLSKDYNLKYLSMGMSGDFQEAIECGANIVRVGTRIFGARDYSKR